MFGCFFFSIFSVLGLIKGGFLLCLAVVCEVASLLQSDYCSECMIQCLFQVLKETTGEPDTKEMKNHNILGRMTKHKINHSGQKLSVVSCRWVSNTGTTELYVNWRTFKSSQCLSYTPRLHLIDPWVTWVWRYLKAPWAILQGAANESFCFRYF